MRLFLLLTLFSVLILTSSFKERSFPKFSELSVNNQLITNEYFKGKRTMVLLGHLGCPGVMYQIRDYQTRKDTSDFQVLIFLENTPDQVRQFNSDSVNSWSNVRRAFKMKPITLPTIAECEKEKLVIKDGITHASLQCRKISRKLHVLSSPVVYEVDARGRMVSKTKGYKLVNSN